MNKYLQKTLIIAIILGSLPITSILGFSTNSFTSNNGFYSSNSITITTTKPLSLVTNNITNSNGFQLTNNTQNNQITNNNSFQIVNNNQPHINNPSLSQSFVSSNANLSQNINLTTFQTSNNSFIPKITTFQPTINNYQLTNNISSFQLSQPLTTNFQLTTNTFKPNIDNLLLNTNNLQANTFQLTQPSQDSFKLTTNNTFNLLNQANINSFQLNTNTLISNNQLKTNNDEIKPLQNKPLDKVKEGYLILVPKNSDKPLYDNYIKERQDKYNIKIISLEERKTLNKPETVKGLLKDIYYNDFKPTRKTFMVSDLKWVVLDEKIAWYKSKDNFWGYSYSDSYYWNLDNDPNNIPEIVISRIIRENLSKNWVDLGTLNVEIAFPFALYPHTSPGCAKCIEPSVDGSVEGEALKQLLSPFGSVTTLYEDRSSEKPYRKPDFSLTKDNFLKVMATSNFVLSFTTAEPVNVFNLDVSYYSTLYTTVWEDKNKDKKVDNYNSEITQIEEFYNFAPLNDNIKRFGIIGIYPDRDYLNDILKIGRCFYNVAINAMLPPEIMSDSFRYHLIEPMIAHGWSLAEVVSYSSPVSYYNGRYGQFMALLPRGYFYIVFGPPETQIFKSQFLNF